eukprot:gene4377-6664_t
MAGGSIIKFLVNGGDATDAFNEFHYRSERAQKLLKHLPKRPAPKDVIAEQGSNGREDLSKAFANLHQELVLEGFFEPSMYEVVYRNLELLAIHAIGVYFVSLGSLPAILAGLCILGIGSGRCGWLMHEGGHYSMTGSINIDKAFQIVIYGVGCGMSAGWWRSQHNRHHATPQKLQHDVDLDTLPLVAFNARIAEKARSPIVRAWLRFQHIAFIPISCLLVALGWQFYLHPRYMIRTKKKFELMTLIVRYSLFFGLLFRDFTWTQAIFAYLFYNMCGAAYIFTNFALSHTHLPVSNPDEYLHWVEYAAKHTTNLTPGFICNWWMAYLNFQIEHHLFPSMPQFRHPIIAPRVKKLFEDHGLVYDVRDYFPCLADTLKNLADVGKSAGSYSKSL